MLPLDINIREAYAKGHDAEQNFIQNLAMFLCTMLRQHGTLMERRESRNVLKALQYLLLISEVFLSLFGVLQLRTMGEDMIVS